MWELKNLSDKDYMEAFKDGMGFIALLIVGGIVVVTLIVWITQW